MDWNELREEYKVAGFFYKLSFFWSLGAINDVFWFLYFLSVGLTTMQISLCMGAFFLSTIIFEVPTGTFADLFGRKASVGLSFIILGLSFVLIPLNDSFIYLASMVALMGVGGTFFSGAESAWLVDNLKYHDRDDMRHRVMARSLSFMKAGGILVFLFVSAVFFLLGHLGYDTLTSMRILWFISGVLVLLGGGYVFIAGPEPYFERTPLSGRFLAEALAQVSRSWSLTKKSAKHVWGHKVVRKLILFGILSNVAFVVLGMAWQPTFKDLGISVASFGVILAFVHIAEIVGLNLAESFKIQVAKEKIAIALGAFVCALFMFGFSVSSSQVMAVLSFALVLFFWAVTRPILSKYYHDFIPSDIRATSGSISSLTETAGSMVGQVLLFGFIASAYGLNISLSVSAVVLAFAAFVIFSIKDYR